METSTSPRREPVKRALLIGIMYSGSTDVDLPELPGTRVDLRRLRDLLIKRFNYHLNDIVVMIDDKRVDQRLKPIKENILREIENLVAGAKAGDHFLFHYSGHSDEKAQQQRKMTEVNGLDQVLVPADKKRIKDDKLHKMLVKRLPKGASLTAIFDSCRSGTLLDLNHYDCNSVWVPWVNKGRRNSKTMQNVIIRRPDLSSPLPDAVQMFGGVIFENPTKLVVEARPAQQKTSVIPDGQLAPYDQVVGQTMTFGNKIEMDLTVQTFGHLQADELSASLDASANAAIEGLPSRPSVSITTSGMPAPGNGDVTDQLLYSWGLDNSDLSLSPTELYPRLCDGWCREKKLIIDDPAEHPHVVSLSASRDGQVTWMDEGESMTLSLIRILEKNHSPTYSELLTSLNHDIHRMTMEMHRFAKEEHRSRLGGSTEGDRLYKVEMDNFQEPQLGSIFPLNMDDVFVL